MNSYGLRQFRLACNLQQIKGNFKKSVAKINDSENERTEICDLKKKYIGIPKS